MLDITNIDNLFIPESKVQMIELTARVKAFGKKIFVDDREVGKIIDVRLDKGKAYLQLEMQDETKSKEVFDALKEAYCEERPDGKEHFT